MNKTTILSAAALLGAAAVLLLPSCDTESAPPITGVSFQMDSVFFWGSAPELVIRSKARDLEVTLSVTVDGSLSLTEGEPYVIGEDGCDTLRIDEPLTVGEHTLHAVALGCCGRYVSEELHFRVLPGLKATTSTVFFRDSVTPLLLEMKPEGWNSRTAITEADDDVMATTTSVIPAGFLVKPTFRGLGTSSLLLECIGHSYTVPLECREHWTAVSSLGNMEHVTLGQ